MESRITAAITSQKIMGGVLKAGLSSFVPVGNFPEAADLLVQIGREFYMRGWALGTSGNFSAVVCREPLRLAITATGIDKGRVTPSQILCVDENGSCVDGAGRSSAETQLHLAIVNRRAAGAVLHTHSVWSTVLSEEHAKASGIAIQGYEMLKGLENVVTHQHREWLPIVENSQNMARLSSRVERLLDEYPRAHGFLLKGHGLYTWGQDLAQAKRHVEIFEFLLEVLGLRRGAGVTAAAA
jgi:methylthioribulose-1-phosphate dehydratase